MTRDGKHRVAARVRDLAWYRDNVSCMSACPVRTDAGRYVQLIAKGRDREALLVARSPNPLASICGRVCAAPCEDACRRGNIDEPIAIRGLKRFVTERFGAESEHPETADQLFQGRGDPGYQRPWSLPVQSRRGLRAPDRRVAVIGAGPAGIACAHDLAVLGYPVTLIESTEELGGMMRHGVPEYRLPHDVMDREMSVLETLGVELRMNAPLSETNGLAELRAEGFDAIFIGVGAWRGRDLRVDGTELDGVIKAVDYLLNVNHGYRVNLGERVLVIGGGSVALDAARTAMVQDAMTAPSLTDETIDDGMKTTLDAARTALRKGAREVHIASLESMDEMPAARSVQGREELDEAIAEGVIFHPSLGPKEFLGTRRLERAVLQRVSRVFDDDGRFAPQCDPDVTETMEIDAVILAVGQTADLDFISPDDGVQLTPAGTIAVDAETMATSAAGVFAAGDAAFGAKIIIDAVWGGKRAANSIDRYLRGIPLTEQPTMNVEIRQLDTATWSMPDSYERKPRRSPELIDIQRRTGVSELEQVYTPDEAREQAQRCLACHVDTIYDASKCVLCNRCVDVCPESVLRLVPLEDLDLENGDAAEFASDRGFDTSKGASAMLKDDDRCIRCGLCAIRCPTGAFTMEQFSFVETEPTLEDEHA